MAEIHLKFKRHSTQHLIFFVPTEKLNGNSLETAQSIKFSVQDSDKEEEIISYTDQQAPVNVLDEARVAVILEGDFYNNLPPSVYSYDLWVVDADGQSIDASDGLIRIMPGSGI